MFPSLLHLSSCGAGDPLQRLCSPLTRVQPYCGFTYAGAAHANKPSQLLELYCHVAGGQCIEWQTRARGLSFLVSVRYVVLAEAEVVADVAGTSAGAYRSVTERGDLPPCIRIIAQKHVNILYTVT